MLVTRLVLLLLAAALAHPACAACSIGISTPGALALSSDGRTLGSSQPGGVAAIVVISDISLQLGGTTINIAAPRLDTYPAGFGAPVTTEGSYAASWLLGSSQGPVGSGASFVVPAVTGLVVTIALDNSAYTTTGFRQGAYTMKTAVTCT